ncbi:MAG: MFS transporter [Fibrobacter sp.]|nr:MFS transporter [Fibrobacter sp.]
MIATQSERVLQKELKIPFSIKVAYGSGDIVNGLAFNTINFFYLFFLNAIIGLPPYLAGLVLLIGRIWDGITDPVMGMIVDNTKSKSGKHRIWLIIAIVPFIVTFFLLWQDFAGSDISRFVIYSFLFILFSTMFTMFNIPYGSMTADLTHDYNERTSITAVRMVFSLLAMIIGAGLTQILAGSKSLGYPGMAAIFCGVMLISGLITYFSTKGYDIVTDNSDGIRLRIYFDAFKNKPFVLLVSAYLLLSIATTGVSGIFIYYVKYTLRMTSDIQSSIIMGVLVIASIAALPLWALVSNTFSKKAALFTGMAVFGCGLISIVFTGLNYGSVVFYTLAVICGIGLSSFFIVLWSMIPDVVEYGQLQSGQRHAGIYYGLWFFVQKLGMALSATINGWVLTCSGFKQEQGGRILEQSIDAIQGINALLVWIPIAFIIIGLIILYFYPIDAKKHAEIRKELLERNMT